MAESNRGGDQPLALSRPLPFPGVDRQTAVDAPWPRTEEVTTWPPGHYYSPIPDLVEVRRRHAELFTDVPTSLPGIDLNLDAQLELAGRLAPFMTDLPFSDDAVRGLRYRFTNDFFGRSDGLVLYGMLRLHRPTTYVEIGSGWSSALVLDTRDLFLDHELSCIFVEPEPERLESLLREGDERSTRIFRQPVQEVWRDVLAEISEGDFLFIDSSHVAKVGSDVMIELLEMVPRLPPGVHVQLHDIFYPFQYPAPWVYDGRYWNEAYLLRALLTHNSRLSITWWNHCLFTLRQDPVAAILPGWERGAGGSIWLRTG